MLRQMCHVFKKNEDKLPEPQCLCLCLLTGDFIYLGNSKVHLLNVASSNVHKFSAKDRLANQKPQYTVVTLPSCPSPAP